MRSLLVLPIALNIEVTFDCSPSKSGDLAFCSPDFFSNFCDFHG
jgi:hypothetical protein